MAHRSMPGWWGSRGHIVFTMVVFIVLASLDNAALALFPAMVKPVAETLRTSDQAIGFMTGSSLLVTAVTAVAWGFWGDRSSRKRLLLAGTVIWVIGVYLSSRVGGFGHLFLWQLVTAIGLGSIASVGFSVISDFVAPARRGLAMSFWGLSQGVGGLAGGLIASQLGAGDFRRPLVVLAAAGGLFALLYLVTYEAPRGYSEPELRELRAAGEDYDHRIDLDQVPSLLTRRTNRWLILQGLTAQFAYGSLIWVPLLYTEKIIAEGYDTATATKVGGLFGAIFQLGGLFSILAGWLGDRMQQRSKSGRAVISAVGILGAIPFFLAFFFIPLRGLEVTNGAGTATLLPEVLSSIVTNGWVAAAFLTSLAALAFTSADSPNWFALISDVNLPEHRGTVFGLGNLANGVGRASGNGLVSALANSIERAFPPPLNWAVGLAGFQLFFLPTGWMYAKAAGTAPGDIDDVTAVLHERARIDRGVPGSRKHPR
ncbi:MAG: MFS transporter [Acidimicrobiia bacterium]